MRRPPAGRRSCSGCSASGGLLAAVNDWPAVAGTPPWPFMTTTFSDGVVLIRPLAVSDAEVHFAGEDDELVRWLSGGRSTLESNRAFIADTLRMWRAGGPQFV